MDINKTPPPLPDIDRDKDKDKDSNKENEQPDLTSNGGKSKSSTTQLKNMRKSAISPTHRDAPHPNKLIKLTTNHNLTIVPDPERPITETERMRVDPGDNNVREKGADNTPLDEEENENLKRPHLDPQHRTPSPTNQAQETQERVTKLRKNLEEANKQVKLLTRSNQLSSAKGDEFVIYLITQLAENLIPETSQDSTHTILETIKIVSDKIDKLSQITKSDNLIVQENLDTINRNHNKTRDQTNSQNSHHLPPPLPRTLAQTVANAEPHPPNQGPPNPKPKGKAPTTQEKPPPHPKTAHHPTRLVIQFLPRGIEAKDRQDPKEIVERINNVLLKTQNAQHLRVVAATYNFHNNLIISTRSDQRASDLLKYTEHFVPQLARGYETQVREDKKWFKIQVDGICTSKTLIDGSNDIHNSTDLHEELSVCNPSYARAAKSVVAKPRWMRSREETLGMYRSSAVFAVDDETAAKEIMNDKSLAAFGRHCSLRAYQDRPPITQCRKCWGWNHTENQCKSKTSCRICGEDHHEKDHNKKQCEECNPDDNMEEVNTKVSECAHNYKCTNCANTGDTTPHSHNHTADSRRCPERLRRHGTARSYEKAAERTENPWRVVVPRKKTNTQPRKPRPKPRDRNDEPGPGEPSHTFINSFPNSFANTGDFEDDPSRSLQNSAHARPQPGSWEYTADLNEEWN